MAATRSSGPEPIHQPARVCIQRSAKPHLRYAYSFGGSVMALVFAFVTTLGQWQSSHSSYAHMDEPYIPIYETEGKRSGRSMTALA